MRSYGSYLGLLLVLSTAALSCGPPDEPVALPPMPHSGAVVELPADPAREFDFWLGTWNVQNQHLGLGRRWKNTGTAVARIHSVAGGRAVLERWSGEARGRLEGFSLRSWDPELGKWNIALNWHGGRPAGFFVMHGERSGESLQLFAPGDRSSRYTFSEAREGSCQWASATPRGDNWVTDWVMQFSRTAPAEHLDASTVAIEPPRGDATDYPETRRLDGLLGTWAGRVQRESQTPQDVRLRVAVTGMLEGFGLLHFVDTSDGRKTLLAMAHDPEAGGWRAYRADSDRQGLEALNGGVSPDQIRFEGSKTRVTWRPQEGETYLWEREIRDSDGSWRREMVAEIQRTE